MADFNGHIPSCWPRSQSVSSISTVQGQPNGLLDEVLRYPMIDLTRGEDVAAHNRLLHNGEHNTETTRVGSIEISLGDFVEVRDMHLETHPVEFLQVSIISEDVFGATKIHGLPFTRTRNLCGKLPKKVNEVCQLLHIEKCSLMTQEHPAIMNCSLYSVIGKRTLRMTNATYPEFASATTLNQRQNHSMEQQRRHIEQNCTLVCRWKLHIYFIRTGRNTRTMEESLERVQAGDILDHRYRVSEEVLRNRWRGGRIRGGSWQPPATDRVDLENNAVIPRTIRGATQKYTLFDSFSGAGGVSRGAQSAGFHVQYAVDKSPEVWETYRQNFPSTKLYKTSVDGFIQRSRNRNVRTDVLHLSPPCQYFSPAHTRNGQQDEENIFSLFGCNELIKKIRPRLITVEETFGLAHDRHSIYLRALVGDFTQLGYSVRWAVIRLCTWGSAQDRKRLIILAAAPGEKLPPFPEPTHSETGAGGLSRFNTIHKCISSIRQGDDIHDVQNTKHYHPPRSRINAHQLAVTITTGGSQMYYPDSTRDFTLREYASLQGFPMNHRFKGTRTSIKRQIGNAFPPNAVKVLYHHLEAWLLKEDGLTAHQPAAAVLIDLDSETLTGLSSLSPVLLSSSLTLSTLMEIDGETRRRIRSRNVRGDVIDLTF